MRRHEQEILKRSVDVVVPFRVGKGTKSIFAETIRSHKEAPKAASYETEAIKFAISECIQRFFKKRNVKASSNFLNCLTFG
jgi:hypothetical protein